MTDHQTNLTETVELLMRQHVQFIINEYKGLIAAQNKMIQHLHNEIRKLEGRPEIPKSEYEGWDGNG